MKRFSAIAFTAAVACTAALFATPSLAGGNTVAVNGISPLGNGGYETRTVVVKYGDIDVSTPAGAAALLERIDLAARKVCGERSAVMMHGPHMREFEACRTKSAAEAVKAVGSESLTAMAAAR